MGENVFGKVKLLADHLDNVQYVIAAKDTSYRGSEWTGLKIEMDTADGSNLLRLEKVSAIID
jgi:hypothetical protein